MSSIKLNYGTREILQNEETQGKGTSRESNREAKSPMICRWQYDLVVVMKLHSNGSGAEGVAASILLNRTTVKMGGIRPGRDIKLKSRMMGD